MRTVLFINAHSRQAKKLADTVTESIKSIDKLKVVDVIIVEQLGQIDEYLKRLAKTRRLQCVIVGSGDGTIVAVLNALKNKNKIVFGFLPLGTSNTFVRSIGLPLDIDEALEVVRKQKIRPASLGSVNGLIFANIAGVGLPVRVARNLTNRTKKYLGPFAYLVSGLKELISHTAFYCTIESDKGSESFYTHYLLIANGKWHGPVAVSNYASVYRNQLVILAVGTNQSRWKYAVSMIRFGLGKHHNDPNVRVIPLKEARIITRPNRAVEADGEVITATPAEVKIIKDAIKVFAK